MSDMIRADSAKEIMKALMQGMEVWQYGDCFRLSESGVLQTRDEACTWRDCNADESPDWGRKATACTPRSTCRFGKALGMMAEGKLMRSMETGIVYRIVPGKELMSRRDADSDAWVGGETFFDSELTGMWQEAE